MVLVFDMDDTLYDEVSYVRSGMRAVACFLAPVLACRASALQRELLHLLALHGRGRVFDLLLEHHQRRSNALVRQCVGCYRLHRPAIRLHAAGLACLRRFRHLPLYVVTDGNKIAQAAKVRALGLENRVRRVFITHRHGIRHAKPSPHCFEIIRRLEGVPPGRVLYVGDNPRKDFVGIRPLGYRTLRVRTGPHADARVPKAFDAERSVASLKELTPSLLRQYL